MLDRVLKTLLYIWGKVFKSGWVNFLKAVFHKTYLVYSWILCLIWQFPKTTIWKNLEKWFVILGEFQQNISNTLFSKTLQKPYYREYNLAGKLIATNDGKTGLTLTLILMTFAFIWQILLKRVKLVFLLFDIIFLLVYLDLKLHINIKKPLYTKHYTQRLYTKHLSWG